MSEIEYDLKIFQEILLQPKRMSSFSENFLSKLLINHDLSKLVRSYVHSRGVCIVVVPSSMSAYVIVDVLTTRTDLKLEHL